MPKYSLMTPEQFGYICESVAKLFSTNNNHDLAHVEVYEIAITQLSKDASLSAIHPDDITDAVETAVEGWARLQIQPPEDEE